MEYRHGQCSSCGAEYKIPASFAHDVAKCKECGGAVHIGPVQKEGEAPAAAAAPAPESKPAPKPAASSGEKKGGTLERLKAERASAAGGAAKGGESTLDKLKRQRAEGGDGASEDEPAAAKKPAAANAGAAKAGATAGRTSRRSGAASKRRSSRRGGGDDDEEGGGGRRRGSSRKKESNTPLLLGSVGVLLLAGGGAAAFFLMGGDDASAAEGDNTASAEETTGSDGDTGGDMDGGQETSGGEDMTQDGDMDSDTPEDSGGDDGSMEKSTEPEKEAPKSKSGDPDSIDLSLIADFGPVDGTTTAEWDTMMEDMGVWMDIDAGAAGNRAKKRMIDMGRKAMPVILNHFKTLDLASEEGRSNGDQIQRAITDLAHGNNFGWKYTEEAKDVYYNKKVVQMYATQWERAENDIEYWIAWTKLDEKDPAKAKELREALGGMSEEQLDEMDDLDVD